MLADKHKTSSLLNIHDTLFNSIITDIKNTAFSEIPQPIVVVGEDGSGKTTMLRQLFFKNKEKGISAIWIDGRAIFNVTDITLCKGFSPNSIIFIDDIDFFFSRCSYEQQYQLRGSLYNEGAPMLIASVEKILPAFSDYKAPFFEGLKLVHIPPVSFDDSIASLFANKVEITRAKKLLSFLPQTIKSVKIARDIIRDNDNAEKDLATLIKIFSQKYKLMYHTLPTYSQHILFAIGNTPPPGLLLAEIKKKTNLPTSVLSIYLRNLCSAGVLNVDKRAKKNYKYMLKDPLFGEWLSFNELKG